MRLSASGTPINPHVPVTGVETGDTVMWCLGRHGRSPGAGLALLPAIHDRQNEIHVMGMDKGSPTVVVAEYDPEWPRRFDDLRARIWPAVAGVADRIEHVGSTSVPGLPAKPIIDVTIVGRQRADVPPVIERLAELGYHHLGNLDIEDREACEHPAALPRHHLYVCPEGTIGIVNQLAVRDYLRAHPNVARRYGELKQQLAAQFPNDVDSYVFGKTDFVLDVLRSAGLSDAQLASIESVNRRA